MSCTISDLPNELVSSCFAYLSDRADIENLRLVCQRFHDLSSPFLIRNIRVRFTSQSFKDLENLASHPIFSKSVHSVKINVSYYDVLLASSLHRFTENNVSELYMNVECMERTVTSHLQDEDDFRRLEQNPNYQAVMDAFSLPDHWDEIRSTNFDPKKATDKQKIILEAWEEYVKLFEDQERVVGSGQGVKTLVGCLEKFTALKKIIITDSRRRQSGKLEWPARENRYVTMLSPAWLKEDCLRTSNWGGTFRTAFDTSPPTHIVHDLFKALATTSIRLKQFEFQVNSPVDMRSLRFTHDQLGAVKSTLNRAEKLYFWIQSWARQGSHAVNNDRPRDEILALCDLSKAYFSSSQLYELHLSLDDYPAFHEFPTVSLKDFLSLHPAARLSKVYFRQVPLHFDELRQFVETVKGSLTWFVAQSLYLLSGTWKEGLEALRSLKKLEYLEFRFPKGAEIGEWARNLPDEESFRDFVLGQSEQNPLAGWIAA